MTKKKEIKQLELPSVLTKDSWFYEENKELCEPYLGRPYISNSTHTSFNDYFDDFVKEKLGGIDLGPKIYAEFGTYVGEAIENGKFHPENPNMFDGQDNLDLTRKEGVEYEKMIIIDRGSYIILGFIDKYYETEVEWVEHKDVKVVNYLIDVELPAEEDMEVIKGGKDILSKVKGGTIYAEEGSKHAYLLKKGKWSFLLSSFEIGEDHAAGAYPIDARSGELGNKVYLDVISSKLFSLEPCPRAHICDVKTGGKNKEKEYMKDEYIQVMLYAHAIENSGKEIGRTYIEFIRREGSHINPPLIISEEQFKIDLPYSKERVDYALKAVDKTAKGLEKLYKTFNKYLA